jgi:hypothetical protein
VEGFGVATSYFLWEHIMTTYTFQRGETVSLALDAVQGDPLTVTSVTAALKPLSAGRTMVDPGAAVAATFVVANRPGGWTLTISAAASAALAAGTYLADAKLVVAGQVTITEPVAVRMIDAVTP